MRDLRADLHIHTCLSPCGELTMSPRAIVEAAARQRLDLIAITDHNTARMTGVVAQAAARHGIACLYGLELQTQEDVHLLAYFDDAQTAQRFSERIYDLLPNRDNVPEVFGDQIAVDEDETIVHTERRLLLNSLALGFEDAVEWISREGGLAVPAHVDRVPYGLIAQLGIVPEGVGLPLAEADGERLPAACAASTLVWNSDAHRPDAVGRRLTVFRVLAPTIDELRRAARGESGRGLCVLHGTSGGVG